MNKVPLDLIVPIYNEGKKILTLLKLFEKSIKTKFRVLLCYELKIDDIFNFSKYFKNFPFEIILVKNKSQGPCSAIKEGLYYDGKSDCAIVYPADDSINHNIIDKMYSKFILGDDVVVASRFIEGGSMKRCPIIKSILVRIASSTLYIFSSIPVRDASNGFRLFSRKLLNEVNIESRLGFAYSLELLAKCNRIGFKIGEIPAQWEERSEGSSRFKILKWLPDYLYWYFYGIGTTWFRLKYEKIKK